MKHVALLAASVFVITSIAACSSSIDTNGQVFIDTSGSATKIAQAKIYVIAEEALVNNLKTSVSSMKDDYERLRAAHQSNSEYLSRTVALARQVQDIAFASRIAAAGPSAWPGSNAELASSANTVMKKATKSLTTAEEQYEESRASLAGLADGSNSEFFISKAIQGASIAATSDADGKFKLSLEGGKRVAIIGKKEKLAWLIWMNPKKGDQIFLTDENINGTQCEACVFNKTQLSSTLAFIPAAFAALQAK